MLIDPRDYCNFIFRGEGQANYVIGAQHKETDVRVAWRIGKVHKTHNISVVPNTQIIQEYMTKIIKPLFSAKYLAETKLVHFKTIDIHFLGKLSSLPHNEVVEDFDQFKTFPVEVSALKLTDFLKTQNGVAVIDPEYLPAFQMADTTQLPASILGGEENHIITIEIKPKQGFIQRHEGIDVDLCQTCLYMFDKVYGQNQFDNISHFCPVMLYSGNYLQTFQAIAALFKEPHRNFRLFLNGYVIHSDERQVEQKDMSDVLMPNGTGHRDDIIQTLCLLLTGSRCVDEFSLKNGSVLQELLACQQFDKVGVVKAHDIYQKMAPSQQAYFEDKSMLLKLDMENMLGSGNDTDILHRYFFAATMKDCSIMVSLRLCDSLSQKPLEEFIQLPNGKLFQYSIKIVDLDPKSANNLRNGYKRFISGVKLFKEHQDDVKKTGYHFKC